MNELTERVRDRYFRVEERGAEKAEAFIEKLEASLIPVINDLD